MRMQPPPFHWHTDRLLVSQFATRVREACTGVGHITVVEVGYEYSARDGLLYRVVGSTWQVVGNALEIMQLTDEEIYVLCRYE